MKILNKINTSWMGFWFWSYYKVDWFYGTQRHFQQYFSYIVVFNLLVEKITDLSVASHWQTLSHNVVSSTPHLSEVWTHNVSSDRHWLYRYIVVINSTTIRPQPPILQGTYTNTTSYGKNVSTNLRNILRRLKLSCRWCFFTVLSVIYGVWWDTSRLRSDQTYLQTI